MAHIWLKTIKEHLSNLMAFWVKMEEFPFHVSKFLPTMQIFYPEHQPKQPVICFMLLFTNSMMPDVAQPFGKCSMVIPSFIENPYNRCINPYYWLDDHSQTQGTNSPREIWQFLTNPGSTVLDLDMQVACASRFCGVGGLKGRRALKM